MSISLPKEKINSLTKSLNKFKRMGLCNIRKFASLVGKLVSVSPTLTYSWLHVKPLEIEKLRALKRSKNNFNKQMLIPQHLQQEFS